MPTYSFHNTKTGEEFDKFMSWKDRDQYLEDNPDLKPVITSAALIGGTGDRTKAPAGFNEVLSKVSEANPYSSLAETHGRTHGRTHCRNTWQTNEQKNRTLGRRIKK